ncbi:MAG: motif putative anchor domain protein [Bradyrhizobium sp.]|nr:motif putative anchor domain protein [Bradyrhizobium sp.]
MNKFLRIASIAAVLIAASPAMAADITWAAPTNATGNASDVMTSGTLFAAFNTGPTTTLNGVTFTSGFAAPITLTGVNTTTNIYSAPNFADPAYNALVGTGAYSGSGAPFTMNISGLTAGKTYAVQIFAPFWNNNWATAFTGGTSTSGLVNLTGPNQGAGASSVPQYVIGTFVADSANQQITLSSPTSYVLLAAAQVRAVPEPATWAMMLLGFSMVGFGMRNRRKQTVSVTYA